MTLSKKLNLDNEMKKMLLLLTALTVARKHESPKGRPLVRDEVALVINSPLALLARVRATRAGSISCAA